MLVGPAHRAPSSCGRVFAAFTVIYILLFNPRTENNTYALLGPVIGLFAAPWIGNNRHRLAVGVMSLMLFLLAAGDELGAVADSARRAHSGEAGAGR